MQRRTKWSIFAFVVVALLCGRLLTVRGLVTQVPIGAWTPAGSMAAPRAGASAVLLQDGRLLMTGGDSGSDALASVEIFDTSGNFSAAAPMNFARSNHVSMILGDGRVLVAGGTGADGRPSDTAEIYDPTANTWSSASPLLVPRSGATATPLQDGRILIAGGLSAGGPTNTLEIYDPASKTFSSVAGVLSSARQKHAAALLADGRVLIVGGSDGIKSLASSDIFDPASGTVAPGPVLQTARSGLSATTLLDGTVLAAGGSTTAQDGTPQDLASLEILSPGASAFAVAPSSLAAPLTGHLAFLLPNNNSVLFVGGTSNGTPLNTSELYMPWASAFGAPATLSSARNLATGSPLATGGMLLVAGGNDGTSTLATSEVYGFATVKTDQADYAPGTPVTITGSGWQPGETVPLSFLESPNIDTHPTLTAVADANGDIFNNQFAPDSHDVNIRFYLTAVGSTSQAQTTFTDKLHLASVSVGAQSPVSVSPGNQAQYTVTVSTGGNGTCTATLGVTTALPTGASASFSPNNFSVTGTATSTLTISTTGVTPNGSTTFTVEASAPDAGSGSGCSSSTVTANGTLAVSAPVNVATTLALNSVSPNSVPFGSTGPVTFTATLTRNDTSAGVVGATVNFTVDGNPAGSAVTRAGGVATFSTYNPSALSAAGHNVQASFTAATVGGTSFLGSTSGSAALTVNKRSTSTSVSLNPSSVALNQDSTATITVTDTDGGTASNPGVGTTVAVTSDSGDTITGTCTLAALSTDKSTCQVTVTPTSLGSGTHNITATFSATAIHAGSNGSAALTVTKRSTSTSVALSPSTVVVSQGSTATVTVTDTDTGTPQFPTGNVSVNSSDGTDSIAGTCSLTSTASPGVSTCSVTVTPTGYNGGSRTITATFSETSVHQGSSGHAALTVNRRTTSTSVSLSSSSVVVAQDSTATITVTDTSSDGTKSSPGMGNAVSVTSDSGDTISGACTLAAATADSSSCQVTVTPNGFGTGTHKISASFSATNVHGASSGFANLTVARRSTSTTVQLTPSTVVTGESSTVAVTVTDTESAGTKQHPAGTVSLESSEATDVFTGACSLTNSTAGVSTCSVSVKAVHVATSPHTITATFTQTDVHSGSSGNASLTVNKADTSATVVSSLNPSVYGQTVTFTATVAVNSPGSGTPTGPVTFYDGVTSIGTGTLSGSQATLMIASLTASGSPHSITAVYGGDLDFNASPTSAIFSQTVNKASTSITNVAAAPEPSTLGASYTVSWTLSVLPPGGGSPTGTVSVNDGNGNTCTDAPPANSCQLTSTSAGPKTLTVSYGGDGNFIGSSGAGSHTVDFGFAGLFDPYAPPSAGRAYKINSTIPLKWDYLDTNGNVAPSSNAQPQVIIYGPFACGGAPNMDVITVNTAGASGYQYDPGSNSWQFNWKTTGLAAGCYNINIKSNLTGQTNGAFPIQLR